MLMSAADYRESLRGLHPVVFVDGRPIESVADEPLLAPGVNAIGVSYDFALRESTQRLMRTEGPDFDAPINRMLAIPRNSADLLNKLEAVRLVCQETGCAQRYLAGDALSAIFHGTTRIGRRRATSLERPGHRCRHRLSPCGTARQEHAPASPRCRKPMPRPSRQ